MKHVKYLILGAGPSGLTLANSLKQKGESSFIVIEKEETAGGLCRSVSVDGSPFDIGGGHFLDVKQEEVTSFLFGFMPEDEWDLYVRDSRIDLKGNMVSHPLEANIWQLPEDVQKEYLDAIKKAGCNTGLPMPEHFTDWIFWKLGDRIAEDYMLPYNRKMFADELNDLGTYWLEKLPNVSFEETFKSCSEHKAYGTQPGHARFYYPKHYGYGEVFLRMAEEIKDNILYSSKVNAIDFNDTSVTIDAGTTIEADVIITTIPWECFENIKGMPEDIKKDIKKLKISSIETRYVPENLDTKAQWIYIPDESKPYHRILVRHNFCPGSKGYWLETRKERVSMYAPGDDAFTYMNEHAYPLNTIEKPAVMERLLSFAGSKNVIGLGRWGEHCHYNSDVVISKALHLAQKL